MIVIHTENIPLVSVVIPAWNAEKTLRATLESVCRQTWESLEILVVDDGSADGTWALLQSLAAGDSRIRPIHQENRGVSAARNAALPLCTGKYTRFVDSDDLLPPDSIELLVRRAEDAQADLVIAGYRSSLSGGSRVHALIREDREMELREFLGWMHPRANTLYVGVLWNKLFRTDNIQESGARFTGNLTYGEDFLFVMNYLTRVRRVSFTGAPVYSYIRHPNSMTFRQTLDSVRHPIANCRVKGVLYRGMCDTYRAAGLYDAYRRRLRMYLLRIALNE